MATSATAVVFDLGKVLLDFDYDIVVRGLASRGSRLGLPEIRRLLVDSPLLPAFEHGRLSSREFFEAIRAETGYPGTFEEFAALFADIFSEIGPMVALQARLRDLGIPTFIFSNTNELAIDHVRQRYPFFAHFDGYILSYEHGAMKPEPALYEVVERLSGRRGPQLVYLDDRAENVEAGATRGWHAILHTDPAVSRQRLTALGVLPDR